VFRELKKRFTIELILLVPDLNKKMRIKIDISDYTTGRVLLMKYNDRQWRPVAYLSKSLNKIERNYKIHDKEMLAIIKGLEN